MEVHSTAMLPLATVEMSSVMILYSPAILESWRHSVLLGLCL